ncbi:MAG: RNA methyltransferase [Ferruginibacter sp.]
MAVELPGSFINSLQPVAGFDEDSFVQAHHTGEQVVSVRFNAAKLQEPSQVSFLQKILGEPVPWSSRGYYLEERPLFTIDPQFHAGTYYVQEASSMFLEQALKQSCDLQQPIKVLDLCAAPGGKSTLLQSLITADSLLVSNEVIKTRANILTENISKWGAANVVVTNNDPKDFWRLPGFFDCVVIDAPCSGSGMFRKDPAAIGEWSLNNVELCSQRQQRIIADTWNALQPGGVLIYSTCSYSQEEDEGIADWLMDQYEANNIRLQLKEEWGVVESVSAKHNCYGYRFYSGKIKGEGFFITVFRKQGTLQYNHSEGRMVKNSVLSKNETAIVYPWLKNPDHFKFIKWQDEVLAIPAAIYEDLLFLQQNLYIKKAGINMGAIIRDELLPSHELVLSAAYAHTLPELEADEKTALDYLRRNDIRFETNTRGWAVVTFGGTALGLVKLLPNRVNNYYPRDWRILNK